MCGRYTLSKQDRLAEMLRERFLFEEFSELRITPRFNIAPTQLVPIVVQNGSRRMEMARWGLVPSWAKEEKIGSSFIHARCETVARKAAFRAAFRQKRCLVPADGFYEWQRTGLGKVAHHFTLKDESLFAFAGLWETWRNAAGQEIQSVSLITTTANTVVAPVHHRMPVLLPRDREAVWLAKESPVQELTELLVPYPAELMKAVAVSSLVNSSQCDGPELVRPLATPGEFRLEAG